MHQRTISLQHRDCVFYLIVPILVLVSACISPATAGASGFKGRVTGDLYSWQGSGQDHVRPYFRFWGDYLAWRNPEGRSVRFHASLRWTSDFADKLTTDPSLFVYDAYAHLRGLPSGSDLYVGRMFVYSGVGSALMDGGRVQYRYNKLVDFNFFGGSSVSSEDPETIRSFDEFLVLGGRLGTRAVSRTPFGASWMLRRREGGTSFHRVGADATRLFDSGELFGRAAYNITDRRLAELMARAVYRPGLWYFSGEYFRREPVVASNWIFTLIDFTNYQTGRVEARRQVWGQLSVLAQAQVSYADDEDTWRGRLGIIAPSYSLAWVHQTGYAGDNNGISGYINRPITKQLDGFVTANLFRYRVQLEQTDRSDAYATTFGMRWRMGYGMAVRAEGQYLRNAVMEDDWRFLVRISKNFSVGSDAGRGQL
jgi:hypothetical protein